MTHQLSEGLAVASQAAVMRAGRFLRHESTADLDLTRYAAEYRELFS